MFIFNFSGVHEWPLEQRSQNRRTWRDWLEGHRGETSWNSLACVNGLGLALGTRGASSLGSARPWPLSGDLHAEVKHGP